jgi:glycerol-3-phosphate acyltransferase PlsY
MNPWLAVLIALLAGYLCGSFPTSYLLGRRKGVDLRVEGSGNLGATNAFRVLGPFTASMVLLVDLLKGAFPVWLALTPRLAVLGPTGDALALAAAMGAVLGHAFSPWVGFRGGKGVATAAGAFLTLAPWGAIPAFGIWLILLLSTRIMSIASIAAAAALPVTLLVHTLSHPDSQPRWATLVASVVLGALILLRHRENLRRLRRGEEKPLWS